MADLQGNNAKSFSGRILEEHNDLQWRVDRPSTHYRAPDTPGSAFAFFTVVKALKSAPWEQNRLAEAAGIAAINPFDSLDYLKYLQKHDILQLSGRDHI